MTLNLDTNVVYAILAAIVAIVLILDTSRIIRQKMAPKSSNPYRPQPYDQENTPTQTWPTP